MKSSFREGTSDSLIFEGVFKYDEYRLPEAFLRQDIIIDVGAHIGFFTYAVLQRGARKIYAFEPDNENYRIAAENLKEYIEQRSVFLTKGAIWRSDVDESELYYAGYIADTSLVNTGSGDVIWNREGIAVPAIPLDEVILGVTEEGQQRIRLLKLDCEGSEWPALLTSKTLHLIDEISGEFHELGGKYDEFIPPFSIGGVDHYTIHLLRDFLQEKGFKVTYYRTVKADGKPTHLGMFFATRASPNSVVQDTRTPLAQGKSSIITS